MFPDTKSRSAALFERAQTVLPGGNTRHSIAIAPYPIYAQRGDGCEVVDADGNVFIDCINNMSANIHGHRHPHIMERVNKQVSQLISAGMPTESEVELAEALCARVPSVETIRFCNSGTEALMFAARAARAFTGSSMIAKIEGGYHGSYDGLDLSNKPSPDQWGPDNRPATVRESEGVPLSSAKDTLILPVNNVEAARSLIREHADQLAAVFLDPLVSKLGFLPLSEAFLTMVREETRAVGALLVVDEVFSFRLGRAGAQGVFQVEPDLSTFGKIIGGGFPIGALGGRREIMEVFNHLRTGSPRVEHSGTFFANPVSMSAGVAALELLDDAMFEHLERLGESLRSGLRDILKELDIQGMVTGRASLVALLPHTRPFHDYRTFIHGFREDNGMMAAAFRAMINSGVLPVYPRGFILSSPMNAQTIEKILDAVRIGLKTAREASCAA